MYGGRTKPKLLKKFEIKLPAPIAITIWNPVGRTFLAERNSFLFPEFSKSDLLFFFSSNSCFFMSLLHMGPAIILPAISA